MNTRAMENPRSTAQNTHTRTNLDKSFPNLVLVGIEPAHSTSSNAHGVNHRATEVVNIFAAQLFLTKIYYRDCGLHLLFWVVLLLTVLAFTLLNISGYQWARGTLIHRGLVRKNL